MRTRAPAALLCLALALLSAAAASWLLAARRPPPTPPPTPPPPVRTIVAYSQRRLHEEARRPPLSCDSDLGPPPPVDDVGDEYSAEGWEELLAPGFSDAGWPPEAFAAPAILRRPLAEADGHPAVTAAENVTQWPEVGPALRDSVYDYDDFALSSNQSAVDADFQEPASYNLIDKGGGVDNDDGGAAWPAARRWAAVPGGGWLLSAHGDRRLRAFHYVRLLAAGARPGRRLFCRLRLRHGAALLLEARPTALWPRQWGAGDPASQPYLLSCALPQNLTADQVESVSVSAGAPCALASRELPLEPPLAPEDRPGARRRDFVVCLKALHFPDIDVSGRLAWWVEALRLLGAQHVSAHVSAVGAAARRLLRHYSARGLLSALRVALPGAAASRTSATAPLLRKRRMELLAYNHCLYSSLERYRFILPLDIDEVWLPTRSGSWRGLLTQLVSAQRDALVRHASLSARNVYLLGGGGGGAVWSAGAAAAKSLVRTSAALAAAHHAASRPASRLLLPPSLAALAHFRAACPQQEAPECLLPPPGGPLQPPVPSLDRWQPRLRRAVRRTLRQALAQDPVRP